MFFKLSLTELPNAGLLTHWLAGRKRDWGVWMLIPELIILDLRKTVFRQRTIQINTKCKIGVFFFKLVHNRVVSSVKAFQMVLKYIYLNVKLKRLFSENCISAVGVIRHFCSSLVENFSEGSKVFGFSFDKIFPSQSSCIYWIHIKGKLFLSFWWKWTLNLICSTFFFL